MKPLRWTAVVVAAGCAAQRAPITDRLPRSEGIVRAIAAAALDGGTRKGTVYEFELPAHSRSERHRHPGPEFFYVVQGEATVQYDSDRLDRIQAGDGRYIPANVPHIDVNDGEGPVKVVVFLLLRPGEPPGFRADDAASSPPSLGPRSTSAHKPGRGARRHRVCARR